MNSRTKIVILSTFIVVIIPIFLLLFLARFVFSSDSQEGTDILMGASPTPTQCPVATPEPFWVEPVISPTNSSTQTILVYIGRGDWATIVLESGTYTKTGEPLLEIPAAMEVDLLPSTTNHLTVTAHVQIVPGECQYGGYTLSTRRDRYGDPLTIIQVSYQRYLPFITK